MSRKILYSIVGILAFSFLSLLALISISAKNNHKNAFIRKWIPDIIRPTPFLKVRNVDTFSMIAAFESSRLYFHNYRSNKVIVQNLSLRKIDSIKMPDKYSRLWNDAYDLFVDSNDLMLVNRNLSIALFDSYKSDVTRVRKLEPPLITRVIPISSKTAIVRGFDQARQRQLFQKIELTTGKKISEIELFNTKNDAGFSTDGSLLYDHKNKFIVYTQYYQNRFICLDTNFKIAYVGKTIDTTNHNLVNTKRTGTSKIGSLMPAVPLFIINKASIVCNGYLLITSSLIADNEKNKDFNRNTTIDLYNLRDGKYFGSFYIPEINNEKVVTFKVNHGVLVALYKSYIAAFQFTLI